MKRKMIKADLNKAFKEILEPSITFHGQVCKELREMHKIGIIGSESKLERAILKASTLDNDGSMSVTDAASLAVELS